MSKSSSELVSRDREQRTPGAAMHVVILLHGTWGRGFMPGLRSKLAGWCREGSSCRAAIRDALGGDTLFEPHNWSGANSVTGREFATTMLVERIAKTRRQHPHALIHLVAHSHGGNVALYACRDGRAKREISSIACLSTPFLLVRLRRWVPEIDMAVHAAFVITTLVSCSMLSLWLASLIPETFQPVQLLLALASIGAASVLAPYLTRKTRASLPRLVRKCRLPASNDRMPPVLILRAVADEAGAALGSAKLIAGGIDWLRDIVLSAKPSRFFGNRGLLVRLLSVLALLLIYGLLALSVGYVVVQQQREAADGYTFLLAGFVAVAVFLLAISFTTILPFVAVFTVVPILVVAAACLAPFGWQLALLSLGMSVSAEVCPPGDWKVVQLEPNRNRVGDMGALQHGTHTDPEALKHLANWLRETFAQEHSAGRNT